MKNRGRGGKLLLPRRPKRSPVLSERTGRGRRCGPRQDGARAGGALSGQDDNKAASSRRTPRGAGHYQSSSWAASSGAALLLGLPSRRARASSSILAMRRGQGFEGRGKKMAGKPVSGWATSIGFPPLLGP